MNQKDIPVRERIVWYVDRAAVADEVLKEKFPDLSIEQRIGYAMKIACTESIVVELEKIMDAIDHIEVAS